MKKILRFTLVALFAIMANAAFADAYKTLTFPDDNKENNAVSNYAETWTAIKGTDSWTIKNFNNNKWGNSWTYIKCGRKNNASVASIATAFAIDKAVANVVVTIDKVTESYVNSISLIAASDAEFTNIIETVNAGDIAAGDMNFTLTTPTANCYYKLVFDCASAKSNGVIQISKVAYYEEGNAPVVVDISNTPEKAYTVAKAKELIAAGEGLATKVYVKGYITEIEEVNTNYGNATYYINDEKGNKEGQFYIYRGYGLGGNNFTSETEIEVGDEVIVYGQLSVYNSNPQITTGSTIYSINGETSGINTTVTDNIASPAAPVYNLAGQQVSKSTKGILIQNGKKFINK